MAHTFNLLLHSMRSLLPSRKLVGFLPKLDDSRVLQIDLNLKLSMSLDEHLSRIDLITPTSSRDRIQVLLSRDTSEHITEPFGELVKLAREREPLTSPLNALVAVLELTE